MRKKYENYERIARIFVINIPLFLLGIFVGILFNNLFVNESISIVPANIIHSNPYVDDKPWDVIYITENESTFSIGNSISSNPNETIIMEGRIVYPEYIVLNLQGKHVVDIIETFHHEMSHLYVFLDPNHFKYMNQSSTWNEYKDFVGVKYPPKIINKRR